MSSIDTSNIDESKPQRGNATTESVRANFAEIKRQLEAARNDVEGLEEGVSALGADKADATALADLSGVTDAEAARENLGLGNLATTEASAFATTLLADEDATAARETLVAQRDAVSTLAALQSLPAGQRKGAVYLLGRTAPGDGGEGVFQWLEGDYSEQVAADPLHGVYVPSEDDPEGEAGCWVRARSLFHGADVAWFGAQPGEDVSSVVEAMVGGGFRSVTTAGRDYAWEIQCEFQGVASIELNFTGSRIRVTNQDISALRVEGCPDFCLVGGTFEGDWPADPVTLERAPSTNRLNNAVITAYDCSNIRLSNIEARSLRVAYLNVCDGFLITNVKGDARVNAANYWGAEGPSALGFENGIQIRGCSYGRLDGFDLRNYTSDGVKISATGTDYPDGPVFGKWIIVANGFLSGMVNDDAIDAYNGGTNLIISNIQARNCRKLANLKAEGIEPAEVGEIIFTNFVFDAGDWNPAAGTYQTGINLNAPNLKVAHGIIRGVDGIGLRIGSLGAGAGNVSDVTIIDTSEIPGALTTGCAVVVEFEGAHCAMSDINIDGADVYGVIVLNDAPLPDLNRITIKNAASRGINVNTANASRAGSFDTIEIANSGAAGSYGLRFAANLAARVNLRNVHVSGYTTPFRDDSPDRLVMDSSVSWAPEAGPSANRPDLTFGYARRDGRMYFDTTLGKYIVSSGSGWVNVDGTALS